MRIKLLALAAAALFGPGFVSAGAAEQEHGFLERACRTPDGKEEVKYSLFVPYDYQGDKPYPLIVYLHGSGERGTDGKRPTNVGLGPAVRKQEKTFPFLVLFPQARREWKVDSEDDRLTMAVLDDVQKNFQVDAQRISLTGMSLGGDGTWNLAVSHPDRWAAIVPVCGNGDPKEAGKIKDIPCWYFEGERDNKHDVENAHQMVQALKAAGGDPQYTEYPGMGHSIWNKVYGTPELYDWLLKQHRK